MSVSDAKLTVLYCLEDICKCCINLWF